MPRRVNDHVSAPNHYVAGRKSHLPVLKQCGWVLKQPHPGVHFVRLGMQTAGPGTDFA